MLRLTICRSDQDGGLCEFPALTTCDPISTNCSSENGTHRCICKEGFEGWEYPDISCKGIALHKLVTASNALFKFIINR